MDYNAGNTQSVLFSLARLGVTAHLTADPAQLAAADKVIFPGVGAARSAMQHLEERGLVPVLKALRQPVLAICLGLQLLYEHSEEGDTPLLGILPGEVRRFPVGLPVPHMGWNTLQAPNGALFRGMGVSEAVYFVHSYYAPLGPATAAICTYGLDFSAAVQHNNWYATQFHPEKSGPVGARILDNFLAV